MQVNHPCCDILSHFDSVQPWQGCLLLSVKEIECSASIAEFRDDIEIIFFLRYTNQRHEIDLRGDFHECFDFSLELLLVPLV